MQIDSLQMEEADLSTTVTQVMCIRNGWLYTFQFFGTSESAYFHDFVQLLNSVHYAIPTMNPLVPPDDTTKADFEMTNEDYMVLGGILAVIIALVILLIVSVLHEKRMAKVQQAKADFQSVAFETEVKTAVEEKNGGYCPYCGQLLPLDSVFCPMCGTKIQKEKL